MTVYKFQYKYVKKSVIRWSVSTEMLQRQSALKPPPSPVSSPQDCSTLKRFLYGKSTYTAAHPAETSVSRVPAQSQRSVRSTLSLLH